MTELHLKADRRLSADRGRDTHFVLLRFTAPSIERRGERPALNLSLVLDRSGSMARDDKLPLAKRATELALSRLSPSDRFSLVIYDDVVEVLARSSLATPEALHDARIQLERVGPGGSTALFGGYLRGAEQVAEYLGHRELGRVLLLTDGLANVGLMDPEAICQHVAELRTRGVHTSTFGVGGDFNQVLLEGMSRSGGGNFYFVERSEQIEDLLTSEVGEALETVARDARVIIEYGEGVEVRPLDGVVSGTRDRGLEARLGALTSSQIVEMVFEIQVPARSAGEISSIRFAISDADGALGSPHGTVEFQHASEVEADRELADEAVVRAAARRLRLQVGERVYALNYQGQIGQVGPQSAPMIDALRKLVEKNPRLKDLLDEAQGDISEAQSMMDIMALKGKYAARIMGLRGRGDSGKAIKEDAQAMDKLKRALEERLEKK